MTIAFSLLLAFLFLPSLAFADSLNVKIQTIYATNNGATVDKKLGKLEQELRSGFPGYDTFHFLKMSTLQVPKGETRSLKLPDDEKSTFEVKYIGHSEEDDSLLRLEVGLKDKIAAEVKASPGSTFFQAGLLHKDGILILAISAEISD